MKRALIVIVMFLHASVLSSPVQADVMLGQIQTFDDPDHHWVFGAGPVVMMPTPFPLVSDGGPGGAGDAFLSLTATGGAGPLSRLSAQNFVEWSGDYIAAGVDLIQMDVRNFGATELFLRLLFLELGMMGPLNAAFSTLPVVVPAFSDWMTIVFDVSPSALTSPLGSAQGALSNASELRIFHNPDPFFFPMQNPPVVASLGVDNITAAQSIPEPSLLTLMAGGLLLHGYARRRNRRHKN